MDQTPVQQLMNLAFKNRRLVQQSTSAGCLFCCKIFESKDVVAFTDADQTCLCPNCGTDTVLGDMGGYAINEENLKKANQYWFKH